MLVGINDVVFVLFFVDSVIVQGLLGLDVSSLLRGVVPCPRCPSVVYLATCESGLTMAMCSTNAAATLREPE
jgi:hypothetical protein